jgi:hypothetical protein
MNIRLRQGDAVPPVVPLLDPGTHPMTALAPSVTVDDQALGSDA